MKIIRINKDEGQDAIPLEVVAKNRAEYYAGKEGFEPTSEEWADEVHLAMTDDFEGVDWLIGNMDWQDVEFCALRLNAEQKLREPFWSCSDDFEICEINETDFPFSIWKSETRKNHREKFL